MTPLSIYQRALDAVSAAVLAGDFDAYLAQLDLPYLMTTAQGQFVLTSREDLLPNFLSVSQSFARRGVTHYERLAREAAFVRSDRIEGWHFTHIIAHGERLTAPWATRQALVRRDHGWRLSEVHFPFQTSDLPLTDDDLFAATDMRPAPMPAAHPPSGLQP